MAKNFVFAYGSLISRKSLEKTIGTEKAGEAITATLKGYERGWKHRIHHESHRTSLGITEKENAEVNGVIFEIEEEMLTELDKREYGLERKEIKNRKTRNGKLWAYFITNPEAPTEDYPIIMSYVDTVLSGCLPHGEDFAAEFIKTTCNWEYPIANDRENPLYPRNADLDEEETKKINSILTKQLKYLKTKPWEEQGVGK